VRSTDALSKLNNLKKPIFTSAEATSVWQVSPSSASETLSRLAKSQVIRNVRQGIWSIGSKTPDPFEVAPVLVRPYPNYVSMYTALFRHGMIDQIPRAIDVMSLGRPKRLSTSIGTFAIHHINIESFGGFEGQGENRSGLATLEKALVDTLCVLSVRSATVTLPEIDFPADFNFQSMWKWVDMVRSPRLKTIVTRNLIRITGDFVET
jgi:predicted transcriptional regulator of viral defense system